MSDPIQKLYGVRRDGPTDWIVFIKEGRRICDLYRRTTEGSAYLALSEHLDRLTHLQGSEPHA